MATLTLKITGLSEEILRKLDERARQRGGDRDGYLRDLIERDLSAGAADEGASILELFAPVQEEFAQSGMMEADLDILIEEARINANLNSGTKRIA